MDCPRCALSLGTVNATPRPDAPALSVDVCAQCAGLWLDGAELAPALPALGGLPHRMRELAQVATPGGFACPRCRGLMLSFGLLETPIDFCRDCHGVWLDGGEFAKLAAPPGPASARPAPPKEVACRGCGATVPLEATYYSDRGLVCGACHQTTDSVEAIDGRSEGARQAYAEHAAAQGAIMAENRRPPPPAYRPEDDIQALRREVRELRRELG